MGKSRPDEISRDASRYVSDELRERVHERGNYQCDYRASDGTRCTARAGLQIEHERPFAIFRSHEEQFLRLLCPGHNRLRAEQVYGADFVQAKIDEARRQKALANGSSG
jgi:hypothetical protein